MKVISGQKYFDTHELAELLDVSEATIRSLRRRGQLPSAKIGFATYTGETALKAYLNGLLPPGALDKFRRQFNKLQGANTLIDTGSDRIG